MKLVVGYPSVLEEVEIVRRMGVAPPEASQVLDADELIDLQRAAELVFVDSGTIDYAVRLIQATRTPDASGAEGISQFLAYGASPRGSLGLVAAAKGLALLRGRDYAVPQDVFDVAVDVLRHRLVLSYEGLAEGVTTDNLLHKILSIVPAPVVESRR
jgi:MoxR-like ATPase